LYRPQLRSWRNETRYLQHSIEFLSKLLWKYEYPHMTGVDGPSSCGGMEYPMMTCLGGIGEDTIGLYSVTVHETGHMWFPMMVGSNERRHMWMDEGLTQYNGYQAEKDFLKQQNEQGGRDSYLALARAQGEVELMRHSDQVPPRTASRAHGVAAYDKPAAMLMALRGILGEETFTRAYQEYGRRWKYKHPTPYDFFNTFENVVGQDMDWFWTPFFFETWTMDQAIASVTREGANTRITIRDNGLAPMPVLLAILHADAKNERRTIPVSVWLGGARETSIVVPGNVANVWIDPDDVLPDIDRTNNVWPR
jgi:aminopeptidase N